MIRVGLRGLLARRLRLALTALAVALGITLVAGTYVFTDTINRSFDRIFAVSYRATDAAITAQERPGAGHEDELPSLPASLLDRVRGVEGVADAEGGVFSPGATILGKDGEPLGVGGAPRFIASAHENERFRVVSVAAGRLPARRDEVALLQASIEEEGFELGDRVAVQARTPKRDYRLVGALEIAGVESFGGAVVAVFTLEEAQRLAGRIGRLDAIDAAAGPGVSPGELKRRLQAALPSGVVVRTGGEQAATQSQEIRDNLAFLRTALLAFAGISLFVGAFIIFNTFSITVAQRTREFALLRTLGATRRQVLSSVLGEGLAIGLLGSAAGLGLGILLASGLRALFDAVGVSLPSQGTVVASRTVAVSLLVGTLATLVSAFAPALRATRVPPVAGLREGAVLPKGRGARFVTPAALVLVAVAAGALVVGLFGGLASEPALSLVGFGAATLFLGVALLSPRAVPGLARTIGRPIERLSPLTGRLARENAMRQPGRTAATAAALMVGVTLVAFASVFAASARTTIREAVEQNSRADLILQNIDGYSPFTPRIADEVAQLPGIDRVSRVRFTHARAAGESRSFSGIEPDTFGAVYDAGQGGGALTALGPGEAVVDSGFSEDTGIGRGDALEVVTARGRSETLRVAGVLDDDGSLTGEITVTLRELSRLLRTDRDGVVLVDFEDEADPVGVRAGVATLLERRFPQVEALTNEEFVAETAGRVDRLLALIYALMALSILVAIFGIVNTLVLSITERTREIGMLRAIGTSRRQLRAMIRYEAIITALIGGVLGVMLGLGLSFLVSRVLDDFTLAIPVGSVALLLVLAGLAGVLAAVLPARRAARLDVLRALAYE